MLNLNTPPPRLLTEVMYLDTCRNLAREAIIREGVPEDTFFAVRLFSRIDGDFQGAKRMRQALLKDAESFTEKAAEIQDITLLLYLQRHGVSMIRALDAAMRVNATAIIRLLAHDPEARAGARDEWKNILVESVADEFFTQHPPGKARCKLELICTNGEIPTNAECWFPRVLDWRASSIDSQRAIELASEYGHANVIRLIHTCGGDIDQSHPKTGTRPLCIAIGKGHAEAAVALIELGVKITPSTQFNPLIAAAEKGLAPVVRILIAKGVNVKICKYDRSPLYYAATGGHVTVGQMLIEAGAKVTNDVREIADKKFKRMIQECISKTSNH